jgi:tRNA(Phe) wybutosine-synthesizing methylase Tyw3
MQKEVIEQIEKITQESLKRNKETLADLEKNLEAQKDDSSISD